jgi:ABC-2 type transport system ATP-binding protein
MQGSVDTLFDLTDGYGIYEHVRAQGVDARFVAFCGGHVACPGSYADAGDRAYLDERDPDLVRQAPARARTSTPGQR